MIADLLPRILILPNGRPLPLRGARPEDAPALAALLTNRGGMPHLTGLTPAALAERLASGTLRGALLLAEEWAPTGLRLAAAGVLDPIEGTGTARIGLTVARSRRGEGIEVALMEELLTAAHAAGVHTCSLEAWPGAPAARTVVMSLGLETHGVAAGDGAPITINLAGPARFFATRAHHRRERESASARRIMHPRSVAVLGASRHPDKIGARIARNIQQCGYTGALYLVNEAGGELSGTPLYRSIAELPPEIDLAIIAVPAPRVEGAVEACIRARTFAALIITSGFAEAGAASTGRRIGVTAAAGGMRLIGPNCFGLLNTDPAVRLNATFGEVPTEPGGVGLLSQSGALGIMLLRAAHTHGVGIAQFVSIGNRVDLSSNDLLAAWADDPRITVIALYLESFGNPRRFAEIARGVTTRKPVIAVKAGRSTAGARAAASHTAALVCSDDAAEALFASAGVVRVDTFGGLLNTLHLLAHAPLPPGGRIGVVTNVGGPAILFADAAEAAGLILPELPATITAALRALLPSHASLRNPVDLTAAATPGELERAIEVIAPAVDVLVAIMLPVGSEGSSAFEAALLRAAARVPGERTVIAVIPTPKAPSILRQSLTAAIPVYRYPEEAARAIGAAVRARHALGQPAPEPPLLPDDVVRHLRTLISGALARGEGECWLTHPQCVELLTSVGIPVAPSRIVAPDRAASAADELGYPVVAKILSRDLLHKSDVGGVKTNLGDRAAVQAAITGFEQAARRHRFRLEGVTIQRFIPDGREAFIGIARDPVFGPVIAAGLGGIMVELLRDVAFGLPPIDRHRAAAMVDTMRGRALFAPFRGAPPCDRGAFEELIVRVSALAEVAPEISELDLNPLIVLPEQGGALVVDARIRLTRMGGGERGTISRIPTP